MRSSFWGKKFDNNINTLLANLLSARWSFILYQALRLVATGQDFDAKRLWDHVKLPLLIFQTGAVFEVFLQYKLFQFIVFIIQINVS